MEKGDEPWICVVGQVAIVTINQDAKRKFLMWISESPDSSECGLNIVWAMLVKVIYSQVKCH